MAKIILEEDLRDVPEGGTFSVPEGAVVTDLAREAAQKRSITLQESAGGTIALGADHGGFAMKEEVKKLLRELGHPVHDLGVYDESPCDYPDIAFQVALAVSQGRCRWGIMVDGAGIGSCMAANKVPGVRAALCYDEATARNSRQHNYANVLTLGGRMITSQAMETIVRTWLDTPFGEARHGRRVDKITDIEKKYLR